MYFSFACVAQDPHYQFGRIDMSKGLSNPIVNDIFQDSIGFIWFATASGLNRYDGHSMKVFKNIPGDSTSLDNDNLIRIFEGPEGRLWIRSYYGSVVYNPKTENFDRDADRFLKKYGVHSGLITYVKKDKQGRFWFMHYDQGLFCFNPKDNKTVRLFPEANDTTTISTSRMSSLAEDSEGNMWVIHQNGTFEKLDKETLRVSFRSYALRDKFEAQLYEYDFMIDSENELWIYTDRNFGVYNFRPANAEFRHLHPGAAQGKLKSGIINRILQDGKNLIWIVTENGGINLLDKKNFSVRYFQWDELDSKSPIENTGYSILKDRQGIIWIGYKNGVSFYHPDIFRFQSYTHKEGRPGTLPFNDISSLVEDKSGNTWIGTNGAGLICFNRQKNTFVTYRHDPRNTNSLSNDIIVSLLIDHENILWIGTYYGGLNRFDGKNFTHYVNNPNDPKSLGNDNIWEIYEDQDHNLWLGTLNGGLDMYNREKKEFYHYKSNELNSIHTPYVPAILQDREGNMLIGTAYGLEVLDKSSGRFTHYVRSGEDPNSISSNSVQCIFQDSRGWVWIGTNGGLNRFDYKKNTFYHLREQDGLAHNSVLTILEDHEHNLWVSTPVGISKLSISENGERFTFQNYTEFDGLIKGVYHENAALRCSSGELMFGGSGGLTIFNPVDIRTDSSAVPVILTDFQIFNHTVQVGELINKKVILNASISQTKKITLGPGNNFFSIEFAALNYIHPERSKYQYKLDRFNENWITTSAGQRMATFTNLDPGDYVFRVRGTNSDGVWSDQETQLHITVLPPFWKSTMAFVLYTLIAFSALLFGRRMVVTRERLRYKIESERLSAQRLHELDELKIKFFTNVSHELRTPLTLIITPLEQIIKGPGQPEKKQLHVVYKNARRLLNLVNQLLDFKRVDGEDLKLNPSEGDLIKFISDLVWSFSDLSEKKDIQLTFNSNAGSLETLFDPDKIEKIVFNLLSNAFKFTPDHGRVSVELNLMREADVRMLQIKVSDTGIGIPPDKQEKVFERFYQNEVPMHMVNQGSGIGLAITQEFVKLHEGTIELQSQVGKGSTFIVTLPLPDINSDLTSVENDADVDLNEDAENNTKTTILLVDDSDDFRSYLRESLRSQYTILEAANGKLGLEVAINHLPELIVCDVMMPEMDGVELCRRIKADPATSHIAVILLTARTAIEQKIEGFQSGANDYITKPFSFEVLASRIENLIRMRDLRHQQFQQQLDIKVSDVHIASADEKLVQDAVKVVEDNLTNENFSVEVMSRMLAMSRVQLYKKLFSLTGKSPIEFIRFIRIKRAAQLLEKSGLTVAEVAYQVGFNNPKYLAKYFRAVYNMLPSEYAARKKAE